MFVDEALVSVAGGRGGDGAVNFHREKYRPKGGPDGGNGGRGGSVALVADPSVSSLLWLRDHARQRAASGEAGGRNNRTGADGHDLLIRVPVGTVVTDDGGGVLADLASPGDRVVVARGGRGGRGNAAFLTGSRRAPGFSERGEPGEERRIHVELRLIADVAVIGYPNSGKSTLVAALSRAKTKIADYPFTTIEPHLGVVEQGGERFTICDIPGLIEGAHEGRGLGLKFLRHAERAPVFLHLIDLESDRDPIDDYQKVRQELIAFSDDLGERAEVVALNKVDAVPEKTTAETAARFEAIGLHVSRISAKEGIGLDDLLARMLDLVSRTRAHMRREGFQLFRTEPAKITVAREDNAWRVHGPSVEKWVEMTDLENPEGLAYLQRRMERAGVERALERAGAKPGDDVRIGEAVFEWWPSTTKPPESKSRSRKS